jgi:tetratricopeptide (TPR) repeat protein
MLYRYRLHPLMRQYAAGKAGNDLMDKLRPRAAKYFLEYAQHFQNNFSMMRLEKENILNGMDWAVSGQRSSTDEERNSFSRMILVFNAVLMNYLDTRGYWSEIRVRAKQVIEAAEILEDKKTISRGIHNLGIISQNMGDYDEARKLYQQSLKIFQDRGDKSDVSSSLHRSLSPL